MNTDNSIELFTPQTSGTDLAIGTGLLVAGYFTGSVIYGAISAAVKAVKKAV